jgi:hypothetical protein
MINSPQIRKIALSFPETTELPHFDKTSFRVRKKIFATLNEKERRACVKLLPEDQGIFCSYDETVIYPVPNKWGKQGWTLVNLRKIKRNLLVEILKTAYCSVAPAKLAGLVSPRSDVNY